MVALSVYTTMYINMSTSAEGESSQNSSSVVVTTFADNGEVVGESFTSKIDDAYTSC